MNEDLKELRKMTESLPPIPKMADLKVESPRCTEYDIKYGTCLSYNLYSSKDASVARLLITSGGELPEHKHEEREYAVIVSGRMVVYKGKERKILGVGDCVVFEINELHKARALEDTWLIGVTVPHSKDFPNA